jgi:putative heme iron utilization protein
MANPTLTFEAFAALYRSTFAALMRYSPKEVGSAIYAEKMAELADAYPEWAELVEAEEDR